MAKQKYTSESILGTNTIERTVFDISGWCLEHNVKVRDSLLLTVVDWETHKYQLVHEPAEETQTHKQEIEQRDRELMDVMYEMLESARDERLWIPEAVLTAHIRLNDPTGYPGNHWLVAMKQDERMAWDGVVIRYADEYSNDLFAIFVGEDVEMDDEPDLPELTEAEAQQVYRFKAALWRRAELWRSIEIQGGQTLADFNAILVDAFDHDWDHLGGFWKRIQRGNSKRFREVDLGSVDPFGDGDGAGILIGELELEVGSELKYVFDFGDWIEHKITLEAIEAPEKSTEYPRVVAQNKPRHRYCRHCKEAGKKTVATWICIECSDYEQQSVLGCEACLEEHHPEHYADEILY